MAKFLNKMYGEWLDDDVRFRLLDPLYYQSDLLEGLIRVPDGFVTDFASVPRLPIIYLFFGNRAHHEAVPHDWIYQTHILGKIMADRLFLEAMKARGKRWTIRWSMFLGVFLFGWWSYWTGPRRFKTMNVQRKTAILP